MSENMNAGAVTYVEKAYEAKVNNLEAIIDATVQRHVARSVPTVQPMELRSFDELERWAGMAARSKMVPRDYQGQPENIMLAVQMGSELGLRPMQSLQNITVIGGRPAVWGDAMLALCMTHPLYRGISETFEGTGDTLTAVCTVNRQGDPPKTTRFSVSDAKTAKLWGKRGRDGQDTPWITNPTRMLQMRARGFALRDAFPDKLRGLISAEEAGDYSLEAAGISAAPPAPAPEPEATTDRAAEWAAATVRQFKEALTYDDVQAMVGDMKLLRAMERLEQTRPELYRAVEAARQDAMDRTIDNVPMAPSAEEGRDD